MAIHEAEIIAAARRVTGLERDDAIGEQYVPDEAVLAQMAEAVLELNAAFGNSTGRREARFTATPNVQEYDLAAIVGPDVLAVDEVVRSGSFVPDDVLSPSDVDPLTGVPMGNGGVIPDGYQGSATDTIVAMARHAHVAEFDFAVTPDQRLRLFPVPRAAETVVVCYTTTGQSMATLPEQARAAVTYAACVALLDGSINRLNHTRPDVRGAADALLVQMRALQAQRDRYERKYEAAKNRLPNG